VIHWCAVFPVDIAVGRAEIVAYNSGTQHHGCNDAAAACISHGVRCNTVGRCKSVGLKSTAGIPAVDHAIFT
jgi:hypothetical protein